MCMCKSRFVVCVHLVYAFEKISSPCVKSFKRRWRVRMDGRKTSTEHTMLFREGLDKYRHYEHY